MRYLYQAWHWARADYKLYPTRFILEWLAWACSMTNAVVFNWYQPNPPMDWLYPIWLVNVGILGWSSYTRGSTWMCINYVALCMIDALGYLRWLHVI